MHYFTRDVILAVARALELHQLAPRSITLLSRTDDPIFDVDNQYIVRLYRPRRMVYCTISQWTLSCLAGAPDIKHIALPQPLYTGQLDTHDYAFVCYQKIIGTSLTREIYQAFSEEQKRSVANDLARFIQHMHRTLYVEQANNFGVQPATWPPLPAVLTHNVHALFAEQEFADISREECERLQKICQEIVIAYGRVELTENSSDVVVLHDDLWGGNILINEKTGSVRGILDFDEIATGSRWREFRYLFLVDYELAHAVIRGYIRLTQLAIEEARACEYAYCYYRATECARLCEAKEQGDAERMSGIITRLLEAPSSV